MEEGTQRYTSMLNGSLDAAVQAYLRQHHADTNFEDIETCNLLVGLLTDWLLAQQEWPKHFVFKGTRLDVEADGLAYVARYYVMIARKEHTLSLLQERPPPCLPKTHYFDADSEAYASLKALVNASTSAPDGYMEGNSPTTLLNNYLYSLFELDCVQENISTDLGFPTFQTYEKDIKAYVESVLQNVEKNRKEVEWRAKTLTMRLHYDVLQSKLLALEKF